MITNNQIEVLNRVLEPMVGKAYLDKWWTSPNRAFDNQPPALREFEEVKKYLLEHAMFYGGT